MYTIKQAALRSGVTVPVLRAWERRYRIVVPERTGSGYRLYDEDSIERVRAMRALVDQGWSPSAAAASLREATDDAVRAVLRGTAARAEPAAGPSIARVPAEAPVPSPAGDDPGALVGRFVDAAGSLDLPALESVLDEMFAGGSFESVAELRLIPALRALGDAWAAGRIDVSAEHAASQAVLRRLAAAYQASGVPATRGVVLVGLPPGARHELGALAFAVTARRHGLPVLYLGADLPVTDWVDAAQKTEALVAVIGSVVDADREPAILVAAALRAAGPQLVIAFGGEAAPDAAAWTSDDRPPIRLPQDLVGSVAALRDAVGH